MKVTIFGLGYVGTVSAGCLAYDGHEVVRVDPLPTKVDLIKGGQSPIVETDVGEIIAATVKAGRPSDPRDGTVLRLRRQPSQANGSLDRRYIRRICEQIGEAFKSKSTRHTVVIRSTILPGTMHMIVIPTLEEFSGKKSRS